MADLIVNDAVILWDADDVTRLDPDPTTYSVDWYWAELNRRSVLLRSQPTDPSLRRSNPHSHLSSGYCVQNAECSEIAP